MEPLHPEDPQELGPYRLLRRIGAGGMGVVFLAVSGDTGPEDLAAIKVIRGEYTGDSEFRARFAAEVDLARRVRGPYTARVIDADTEGLRPWSATEYVPGPSLGDAVRDGGPFPEKSLRALTAGLAEALNAIHSVGLVHRDLKPSNILLSSRGPQVIDFGIARAVDATVFTRTGQTLGTPAFMSPEQAVGRTVDHRSDLFSLGGVLVFAATGRQPFGAGDPAALLYRVVNEEPDLSGVPEGLSELVTACLAKDPDERPGPGSILGELTGTALPKGDEEPTEWLPPVVATRVMETVAEVTRLLPTPVPPKIPETVQVTEVVEVPEKVVEASQGLEVPEVPREQDAPEEPPVPVETKVSKTQEGPLMAPAPERTSAGMIWGVTISVLSLVLGLAYLVDNTDTSGWGSNGEPIGGVSAETSPTPETTPSASEANPSVPSLEALPSAGSLFEVEDAVFLGGSDRFAALSPVGVDVFDVEDSTAVGRLAGSDDSTHRYVYHDLAVSHDGTTVAAKTVEDNVTGQAKVHVWDVDRSERHTVTIPEGERGNEFALSPDGSRLFIGQRSASSETVVAYDVTGDERLYDLEFPENSRGWATYLTDLTISSDGELLIVVVDGGISVRDADTGEPHPSYPDLWEAPEELTGPVAFDDGLVATATWDSLLLWDLSPGGEPEMDAGDELVEAEPQRIQAHEPIRDLSIGDGGERIVATGRDSDWKGHYLTVWDREGEVLFDDRTVREYFSVTASPTDEHLLASYYTFWEETRRFDLLEENLDPVQEYEVSHD